MAAKRERSRRWKRKKDESAMSRRERERGGWMGSNGGKEIELEDKGREVNKVRRKATKPTYLHCKANLHT